MNRVAYNPDTPCTVDFGAEVLAQSLPYGASSISGGEALTREVFAAMLWEKLPCYGLAERSGAPAFADDAQIDGSAGVLRYGCDDTTKPMSYLDADGKPLGFDLDVVSRIAYELNMTVEFTPMGFDKLFAALTSGEVQMVGGCMSLTVYRQETYSCTDAYYDGGIVLVVQTDTK